MTTITHFFVLSSRGDKIIARNYRYDIFDEVEDLFFRNVRNESMENYGKPIFNQLGINFFHVRKSGLYIVCTSRENCSPITIFELLERACILIRDFTGQLSEDSIRKNFVMVYELLDELFDWGKVQTTQTNILTYCIHNEPIETVDVPTTAGLLNLSFIDPKTVKSTATCLPIQKKNDQIFVDVLERINCEMNAEGSVLRSEIIGSIVVKSYLMGSPLIRIALNQDLAIGTDTNTPYSAIRVDALNFNEIINREEFEMGRQLSFYPQDGETTLLSYRVTNNHHVIMPFRVSPYISKFNEYKIEASFKVRSDFPASTSATGVFVRIPVPKNATSCGVVIGNDKETQQSYEYKEKDKVVIWGIKKFPGASEQFIKLRITLPEPNRIDERKLIGPVSMKFEIPMHNMSGLQLRYLKIGNDSLNNDNKNKQKRWVRYVTQAGSYCGRVSM
ncbi:clathrin coat assembly protein [Naegleria gruberi]|uniref:Clathrin coat assembly protein n=1 Tax=Naegleria gruberi TaxID=5762 RepID=D2V2G6_NAEGR|nr:clathrin coat assembly protein [Naegleria gruberi]EFC48895.1 clathrin coat assembly protein [Naegleria gruberi]|eukprot:XP_002681639.1 clathrin coat assembly protein [Naegleria gruberi strain NEG-M]